MCNLKKGVNIFFQKICTKLYFKFFILKISKYKSPMFGTNY